jgi:hypothetical protein
MTRSPARALDSRRKAAIGRLRAALGVESDVAKLDALVDEIETLDQIRPLLADPPSRWLWPILVGSGVLLILSIGLAIRLPRAAVDVDVQATSFALTFGGDAASLLGALASPAATFQVQGEYHLDGVARGSIEDAGVGPHTVSGITPSASATIQFYRSEGRTGFKVLKGSVAAQLSYRAPNDSKRPLGKQLVLGPNASISIAATDPFLLEATSVESIVVSDPQRRDAPPPAFHLPSLVKGTLTVWPTEHQTELPVGARLQLAGISAGHCMIRAGEHLEVAFSGDVGKASRFGIYGPELAEEESFLPTLFQVVTSWPLLASIFAAASTLCAALYALRKRMESWE